ncbi:MAG: transglutaminase domain-containing protein [bacterium]
MDHREQCQSSSIRTNRGQAAFRIVVGIAIVMGVLIGTCSRFRESEPESTSMEITTPASSSDRIDLVYEEKYAEIVNLINTLDHEAALSALLDTRIDTNDDLFIRGIFLSWLGRDEEAAESLTDAAKRVTGYPASQLLLRHTEKWGLDPTTIEEKRFTVDDSRYIRRCHFLQRIADRVTSGSSSELEKTERLLDWVFRHIAFFEPDVINIGALDILLRGYGVCDRSAWVLALLCQRAGLPATVVLLGRPTVTGRDLAEFDSTHTLCQVLVSGQWLLCDTIQGTFVTHEDSGERATLKEILARLEAEPENTSLQETFDGYHQAGVGAVFEADGTFPRFRLLDPYMRVIPPYPAVFEDLDKSLEIAYSAVPEVDGKRTNETGVWDYPFYSRTSYNDAEFLAYREKILAPLESYRDARILQLLGFPIQAIHAYARSVETSPPEAEEDLIYFMAQCHYETGVLQNAETGFQMYLEKYPNGRWRPWAIYQLARAKEERGDLSGALELYRSIEHLGAARQRALAVGSRQ